MIIYDMLDKRNCYNLVILIFVTNCFELLVLQTFVLLNLVVYCCFMKIHTKNHYVSK